MAYKWEELEVVEAFVVSTLCNPDIPYVVVKRPDGGFEATMAVWDLEGTREELEMLKYFDMLDFDSGYPGPIFDAPKWAILHEQLVADQLSIGEDLEAFNAPSECDELAYGAFDRQHKADFEELCKHTINKHYNSPVLHS